MVHERRGHIQVSTICHEKGGILTFTGQWDPTDIYLETAIIQLYECVRQRAQY